MSTADFIKRHINLTPVGVAFTTRDCLKYGSRRAVDHALFSFVRKKVIVRLTNGVFMRMESNTPWPSALTLARVKAHAFGKTLVEHSADLAYQNGLTDEPNSDAMFYVNGGNSCFRYRDGYIFLRSSSNKRIYFKDAPIGKTIRALWHLGNERISSKHVEQALIRTPIPDLRRRLVLSKAWMPYWLADFFPTTNYPCPPNSKAYDAHFTDYFAEGVQNSNNSGYRVSEELFCWPGEFYKLSAANLQDFTGTRSQ